jgi:hypothetical protein
MGIKMDKTRLYVNDKGLKRRKIRCQMMVILWLIISPKLYMLHVLMQPCCFATTKLWGHTLNNAPRFLMHTNQIFAHCNGSLSKHRSSHVVSFKLAQANRVSRHKTMLLPLMSIRSACWSAYAQSTCVSLSCHGPPYMRQFVSIWWIQNNQ